MTRTTGKIAQKPKLFSVKDIYKNHVKNLLKNNPSMYVKYNIVYTVISEELEYINRSIPFKKQQWKEVKEKIKDSKQHEFHSLLNDLSDIEISIKAFEERKEELLKISKNVEKVIDYKEFKAILKLFNQKAAKAIIDGKLLNLQNRLGYIGGKRIERNHNIKAVNWGATNKLRDENGSLPTGKDGKKVRVFFTDDDFTKISWFRPSKTGIRNLSVYQFQPATGKDSRENKGFRLEFINANKINPLLKLKYIYVPLD